MTLYAKHPDQVAPITSVTKLMTAMVVLEAQCPLDEAIEIDRADVDVRKHTRSRLPVGARLGRGDLLWVALMASENRAASALARTYPGGTGVAEIQAASDEASPQDPGSPDGAPGCRVPAQAGICDPAGGVAQGSSP